MLNISSACSLYLHVPVPFNMIVHMLDWRDCTLTATCACVGLCASREQPEATAPPSTMTRQLAALRLLLVLLAKDGSARDAAAAQVWHMMGKVLSVGCICVTG